MISVFGSTGFIGSRFCELYPEEVIRNLRDDYYPRANEILYLISTVDNHNVFSNPLLDLETNVGILLRVLQNCEKDTVFNYISTWSVYGDVELPAMESSYCNPKGFYGITKRAAEQLLISYCETFGMKYRILRLCNVIGETDKGVSKVKNALQYLIGELKENRPINLYYKGDFYRDYMYVDDICSAIHLCMTDAKTNEIINIGSGKHYRFGDLIIYCKNELESDSVIGETDPSISAFHTLVQTRNMYLDNSKLRSYGFRQKYSMWESLEKIICSLSQ